MWNTPRSSQLSFLIFLASIQLDRDCNYELRVSMDAKSRTSRQIVVDGEVFEVEICEIPFREGAELRCCVDEEEIRVSDRGLGVDSALKVLAEEVRQFKLRR